MKLVLELGEEEPLEKSKRGDLVKEMLSCNPNEALDQLSMLKKRKQPLMKEVQVYRKYVPRLIAAYRLAMCMACGFARDIDERDGASPGRARKRWTRQEEEILIDSVASGTSLIAVAADMGRSPLAISSKVSELVGIGRIEQKIAGKFVGSINGIYSEGFVEGVLRK